VRLSFICPSKPVENAYIESFNGHFRDKCRNEHWSLAMAPARRAIEAWRIEYTHRATAQLTLQSGARGVCQERLIESRKNTLVDLELALCPVLKREHLMLSVTSAARAIVNG
jgi:putative transposase